MRKDLFNPLSLPLPPKGYASNNWQWFIYIVNVDLKNEILRERFPEYAPSHLPIPTQLQCGISIADTNNKSSKNGFRIKHFISMVYH